MADSQRAMAFFMNLGIDPKDILDQSGTPTPEKSDAPSPRDTVETAETEKRRQLQKLSSLSSVFGSGIMDLGDPNPKNFPPREVPRGSRDSFGSRSRTSSFVRDRRPSMP